MYIMKKQLYWVDPSITEKDIEEQSVPRGISAITTSLLFTLCVPSTAVWDLIEGKSHPVDTRLCAIRADRCQGGVVCLEA